MDVFVNRIADALAARLELPAADLRGMIQSSHNPQRGDLSLPCFQLAARVGRPGKDGALALAGELAEVAIPDVEAAAAGPFLNFRLAPEAVSREVLSGIAARTPYGGSEEGAGKTVVIDFSSPNIAKPFHLGHLRSTVIGWSLRQIYRALGYTVVGVNHLGDWGTQFGFMITAWKRWEEEGEGRLAAGERDVDVFYELYVRINQLGKQDPAVREEARAWFKRLEDGDPEAQRLWTFFVDRSKAEFARIYELLGIEHESDAGEAFYNERMPAMVERLQASGLLVEGQTRQETAEAKVAQCEAALASSRRQLEEARTKLAAPELKEKAKKKLEKRVAKLEGQLAPQEAAVAKARAAVPAEDDGKRPWGVDLSGDKLGFCMLLKGDGGTTYSTRDVTAGFYRGETYDPVKILYVVGTPQADHFAAWFRVAQRMEQPWAEGLVHVGFGQYLGMSTRGGTAVFLEEVLERARIKAREAAAQATKKVELSDEEAERVARAIGTGAVRFFDLRAERTKDIDLGTPDGGIAWDRLLDLKGDTGPYLQFAYARLAGILRRYEGPSDPDHADYALLSEPEAQALVKVLGEFPAKVRQAAGDYEPSVIARYVLELAQKTHVFVHHHRVIDATPTDEQAAAGVSAETLRATRVFLVSCAKKVIAEALDLLGIEALEKM